MHQSISQHFYRKRLVIPSVRANEYKLHIIIFTMGDSKRENTSRRILVKYVYINWVVKKVEVLITILAR